MFDATNRRGMQVVLKFLLDLLDKKRSHDLFKFCWPVVTYWHRKPPAPRLAASPHTPRLAAHAAHHSRCAPRLRAATSAGSVSGAPQATRAPSLLP